MQYREFINAVQDRAGLPAQSDAENLTEVVLSSLGERLYRTNIEALAAQLPKELEDIFYQRQDPEMTRGDVDRYDLEEFYNRVHARLDLGYPESVRQAKAVLTVLREAVTPGALERAARELPPDFQSLLREGNGGQ